MPSIKRNQLVKNPLSLLVMYYLAVNDGVTADALVLLLVEQWRRNKKVLRSGKTNGTAIVLETGLDTAKSPQLTNKTNYILLTAQEANFTVSVDRRFFTSVLDLQASVFSNGGTSGESNVRLVSTNLANTPSTYYKNERNMSSLKTMFKRLQMMLPTQLLQ